MIRLKLVKEEKNLRCSTALCVEYDERNFHRLLGGGFLEADEKPPFRDLESQMFIREIDRGELVEGDWYSYVSPYGRTCMINLCGGTKYALTVISNSRNGVYTPFRPYGDDIWGRLQSLDMDVLIYYNVYEDSLDMTIPEELTGCTVEEIWINGKKYENVICGRYITDPSGVTTDSQGRLCCDGRLKDYEWKWWEHLEDIFSVFQADIQDRKLLTVDIEAEMTKDRNKEFWEWSYTPIDRTVLCCTDHIKRDSVAKYPKGFYFKKFSNGRFTVEERLTVHDPYFQEALTDVVNDFWDASCESAYCVVIDTNYIGTLDDFRAEKLWYFADDGKTISIYSGSNGMKKLFEFLGDALKDGMLDAVAPKLL